MATSGTVGTAGDVDMGQGDVDVQQDSPISDSESVTAEIRHVLTGVEESAIDFNETMREHQYNEIAPSESVYGFMLFMAPLSRKRYGHFCTSQNGLAFLLFWLNALVQVSLTFIAGRNILATHQNWRASLIYDNALKESVAKRVDYIMDRITLKDHDGAIGEISPHIQDRFQRLKEYTGRSDPNAYFKDKCCIGVECADLGLPCCQFGGKEGLAKKRPGEVERKFKRSHRIPKPGEKVDGMEDSEDSVQLLQAMESKPHGAQKGASQGKTEYDESDDQDLHQPVRSDALCVRVNQTVHCAPPSAAYMDYWSDLDSDGDGWWTVEEARADASNLGCYLGVPPEDMFRSTCRGIEVEFQDAFDHGGRFVDVPIPIQNRTAVPYSHFVWFEGVMALCTKTDVSLCSRLLSEGTFDGATNPFAPNWKGGIRDLDTAMSYCNRMLKPGGLCDELMPGTYTMYQSRTRDKCGEPVFELGQRYMNPHDTHDVARTNLVQFKNVADFETTHSRGFQFFLALLLIMWYVNLLNEFTDIINLADFLWNFPVKNVFPLFPNRMINAVNSIPHVKRGRAAASFLPEEDPEATGVARTISAPEDLDFMTRSMTSFADYLDRQIEKDTDVGCVRIDFISRPHQFTCFCMLISRLLLATYMMYVGTMFLLSNFTYIDLLLNAVALAFVLELDEYLYACLVSQDTKAELANVEPLRFKSCIPQKGIFNWVFRKQFMGFVVLPIIAVIVVYFHDARSVKPVLAALRCLCQHTGDECEEAHSFPKHWWDDYWAFTQQVVPGQDFKT